MQAAADGILTFHHGGPISMLPSRHETELKSQLSPGGLHDSTGGRCREDRRGVRSDHGVAGRERLAGSGFLGRISEAWPALTALGDTCAAGCIADPAGS